jgi:hypothetical protein
MESYNGEKVIFVLTEADVKATARQYGFPEDQITDGVLEAVKKGVEFGLECWQEVVKEAIDFAMKSADDEIPQLPFEEIEMLRRLGK